MSLRSKLLPIIRHCTKVVAENGVVADENIEIECRVLVKADEFYGLFCYLMDANSGCDFIETTKQRDAIFDAGNGARSRITCTLEDATPLFAVNKQAMLSEQKTSVKVGDFEVRLDARREQYRDAQPRLTARPMFWRLKDRRSFIYRRAPAWQIDLTHIIQYKHSEEDVGAFVRYEMEFELRAEELGKIDPIVAIKQLESLMKLTLGVDC